MKRPQRTALVRMALVLLSATLISACASYGSGVQQALDQAKQGDLKASEASF